MMTMSNVDASITGTAIRLGDGRLAIGVIRLGTERLVVSGQALFIIDSRGILDSPAICARCQQSDWWIADDYPLCLRCSPPSAEEEAEIWSSAHDLVKRNGPDEAHGCLDFLLLHGKQWGFSSKIRLHKSCDPTV